MAQQNLALSDAIKVGLKNNFDIRIEDKKVELADNNNSWGEAGRMPKVDIGTTFNNSTSNLMSDPNLFNGQPFPGFTLKNNVNNTLTPVASVGWTFFSGNKILINKQRLANLEKETEGNADIVVANTIQTIILGYYRVVLEGRRLEEFGKQLRLSSDKYNYLKVKSDVGGAVISEVLLEEGNYLNDSTNFINQELVYRNALRQFNFILAEDNPNQDYILSTPLAMNWEHLDQVAMQEQLDNNVDLKKLYISQTILGNNTSMNKSDRWPVLGLNTGYQYNMSRQDLTNATYYTSDGTEIQRPDNATSSRGGTMFLNFNLSFNLFNGGKINRAIQNAIIDEDIGNIRIERMKTSLNRDLEDAFDAYSSKQLIYDINKRKTASAKQNLDITTEKYRNGTINSFDFRVVQNNHLLAAIQELQSVYNLLDSRVTLMRLTGGILESYIDN